MIPLQEKGAVVGSVLVGVDTGAAAVPVSDSLLSALLEEYAREHHIPFDSHEQLCADPQINEMMKERIDTLQQQLAHYEQIKRFTLLPHHFSMERGELTNTLKIKRRVLNENYKKEIDAMYAE